MNNNRQHENGGALVMALMLIVVVGMLTASMTSSTQLLSSQTVTERAELQALQAADGGIEQARLRLREDANFRGEVVQIGGAEVTIEVVPVAERPGRWTVTATARCEPRGEHGLPLQRCLLVELVAEDGLPRRQNWRER